MKLQEILDPTDRGLLYSKMLHRSDLFSKITVHYDGATENYLSGLYLDTLLDVDIYVSIGLYETNDGKLDVWVGMEHQDIQLGVYETVSGAIEAIRVIHRDAEKWMDENDPDREKE